MMIHGQRKEWIESHGGLDQEDGGTRTSELNKHEYMHEHTFGIYHLDLAHRTV